MGKLPHLELVSRLFGRDQEISNLLVVDPKVSRPIRRISLEFHILFLGFSQTFEGLILLVTPDFWWDSGART